MLGVNQLDFINYTTALKGNYRKGVHKLEAILANPTHAAEFAANLGGVSVVLGVPIGKEDKNSEALLSLLLASSVADDAVYTWLGQFYEFTSWDELLGDAGRCQEMMADPFIWRAVANSGVAVGKAVATLAGLDCGTYADMTAVAASSTAMAAVIANSTALNAVAASSTAMAAVAASYVAVAAVYGSAVAVDAVKANGTAWATLTGATSAVMGKAVAVLAGLNPDSYADMTAVAASQTAMAAVAASQTAMAAVAASQTAMAAVIANSTALNAVAASSTAIAAVAASATARAAIYASDVAFNTFLNLATYDTISGTHSGSGWSTRYSGPCIVLQWCYSYSSGTSGIRTCLDGTASRQYTSSQRYNSSMGSSNYNDHNKKSGTYYKEFVFCSKLETYNSQGDWPAISIAYFKLP